MSLILDQENVKNENKNGEKIKTKREKKIKDNENDKILNKKHKREKQKEDDTLDNETKKTENPENLEYIFELTSDSKSYFSFDNTFCVFKSINNILLLIYSNKNVIIVFNLNDNIAINKIKNVNEGNKFITNFRHYLDIINNRDLVLSITAWDNNIKIWNIESLECICDIKDINSEGYLYSAAFLNDNNKIYIITNNYRKAFNNYNYSEGIKIFDLQGNMINKLKNSDESSFSINIFYDNKLEKNFIIVCHYNCVKSYDYNENRVYKKYYNNNNSYFWMNSEFHYCSTICDRDRVINLIEASAYGIIRIWNFHSGKLIKKIILKNDSSINNKIFCMCLWDDKHIFVGCEDYNIKLIDFKKGIVIKILTAHSNWVMSIKKIIHPIFGECLISQGYCNDEIKLITT